MRTLGKGLVEIKPAQGFCSETASTVAILASSHLGFGLSTTHVCSGAILGSGIGRRGAEVHWGVAGRMGIAWLLTLPAAGVVGAVASFAASKGAVGLVGVLVMLIGAAIVVLAVARHTKVDHTNVNDSHEVTVRLSPEPEVAAATPAPVPVQATVADLLKPAAEKPGGHHREGTDGSNPRMAGSGAGR